MIDKIKNYFQPQTIASILDSQTLYVCQKKYYRRRETKNYLWLALLTTTVVVTLGFFVLLIGDLIVKGIMGFHFFMITAPYNPTNLSQSGFGPFLVTTIMLVFLVLVLSLPLGFAISLFTMYYCSSSRLKHFIMDSIVIYNAVPSIIFGIFGMSVFVILWHIGQTGFSILAASLTLLFVILPTMIGGFNEALQNISIDFILNAKALGASDWQVIQKILLPQAKSGFLTSTMLSISRVIGETGPVFLTLGAAYFTPTSFLDQGRTLTGAIFLLLTQSNDPSAYHYIYALCLVTVFLIFVLNLTARLILYFQRRHQQKYSNR